MIKSGHLVSVFHKFLECSKIGTLYGFGPISFWCIHKLSGAIMWYSDLSVVKDTGIFYPLGIAMVKNGMIIRSHRLWYDKSCSKNIGAVKGTSPIASHESILCKGLKPSARLPLGSRLHPYRQIENSQNFPTFPKGSGRGYSNEPEAPVRKFST